MVALVHLPQDTERTIIPYLNKKETLEGRLNDGYRTWKNYKRNIIKKYYKKGIYFHFCLVVSFSDCNSCCCPIPIQLDIRIALKYSKN